MRIDTQAIQHGLKQTSQPNARQAFFVPPVRRLPGIIPLKGSKQSARDERIATTSLSPANRILRTYLFHTIGLRRLAPGMKKGEQMLQPRSVMSNLHAPATG